MSPSDSHCKLCTARQRCDAPRCPLAYLAEGREPGTDAEREHAEKLGNFIEQVEAGGR